MSKFDQKEYKPGIGLLIWLIIVAFLLVMLFSCNRPKKNIVVCTSFSCDTISSFDTLNGWLHYHKPDGTDIYLYHAKIDTIN